MDKWLGFNFQTASTSRKARKIGGVELYQIEPVYVIDIGRPSLKIELEQMNKLRKMMEKKFPVGSQYIMPTKFYEIGNIRSNEIISKSYKKLKEESFMGSQYEWLGWLAQELGSLELCVHKDDKAHYFLKNYSISTEEKVYIIDRDKTPKEINDVFGSYRFPLFDYTKTEMEKEAKEKGFVDIMFHTWFCYTPIKGKPCGICNPCGYSIEEKMEHRFTKMALIRNKYKLPFRLVQRIKRKLIEL